MMFCVWTGCEIGPCTNCHMNLDVYNMNDLTYYSMTLPTICNKWLTVNTVTTSNIKYNKVKYCWILNGVQQNSIRIKRYGNNKSEDRTGNSPECELTENKWLTTSSQFLIAGCSYTTGCPRMIRHVKGIVFCMISISIFRID